MRHATEGSPGPRLSGTLVIRPGEPVSLRASGQAEQPLRIYSIQSSVDVGQLRGLARSEPALRLHRSTGDLYLSFTSRDERDTALEALASDSLPRSSAGGWPVPTD